jgi:hypothetical protein
MMDVERQIITAACEINPDANRLEELRQLMEFDFDADHLINLALQNGVGGLLYRSLVKADSLQKLGSAHNQRLQSIYYQTARLNLKLIHDIKEVLKRLNQENLDVVLLQGITLLDSVYEDIGLRPMKDIDLWVLPEDYDEFVNLLKSLGYEKETFYPSTCIKDETAIDINTHILWADRVKARGVLLEINQENIFENAVRTKIDDQGTLCLHPYDQVLYLSLHAIKHHAERLIWLLDIKGLIDHWTNADWRALIARARELGLQKTVAQIIYLLDLLLKFQPPAEIKPALQTIALSRAEKAMLGLRRTRDALPEWGQLILLPAGKGLPRRAAFILETLFPRPEILRQVFANSPNLKTWQLYWKRSLQLMGFPKSF